MQKVKVWAPDKAAMREFLANSGVDFACRAMAWDEGDGIATVVLASSEAIATLETRRTANLRIEVLETLPDSRSRKALVSSDNRFFRNRTVSGFGERIDR
ncbi:hypothetical protein [Sedimentitalea sp.]|uniref:hypothetical protein n=1 Tax=Sedimentitalea sp. TaxID=2048915 RepID=UPI00329691BB